MLDTMWAGAGGPPNPALLARDAYIDMMRTAQNVADRYELSREEIDAFALRSHQHAAAARDSGRLAAEIHPVEIEATRRQTARVFEHDESIRGDTTAEKLAALAPQPNTTQMTAGNSSPLNDGASAVVLAGGAAAEELGVEPLARVVSSANPRAGSAVHGDRARVRDPQGPGAGRPHTGADRRVGDPRGLRVGRRRDSCASCRASSTASRSPTNA